MIFGKGDCGQGHKTTPEEVKLSGDFSVQVRTGIFGWKTVPAFFALTADGTGNRYKATDEELGEFNGLRKVNKVAACAVASVVSDKPVRFRIKYLPTGWSGTLKLRPGEKRIECPPDDPIHCAVVSVQRNFIPDATSYPHRIVFERGYHTADDSSVIQPDEYGAPVVNVPDSTIVIFEEGSQVCASFNLEGVRHVKLCGNGFINQLERCSGKDCDKGADSLGGFRKGVLPSIYIHRGCSDVSIEGITMISEFRGICGRCSKDIRIDDVVIMTSSANGDGINFTNCTDCTIENSLVHSEDDCVALFNNRDSIHHLWDDGFGWPAVCSGITVRNCVLWTACRPFCIGGHGTGVRSDCENVVENVIVEDCVVAGQANAINSDWSEKTQNYRRFWSGGFRILSQSGQTVRNITFRNIVYRWTPGYNGQPIHVCVRDNSKTSYSETGGYRIENLTFENISFENCNPQRLPVFVSASADAGHRSVTGVVFKNVRMDGKPLVPEDVEVCGNLQPLEFAD